MFSRTLAVMLMAALLAPSATGCRPAPVQYIPARVPEAGLTGLVLFFPSPDGTLVPVTRPARTTVPVQATVDELIKGPAAGSGLLRLFAAGPALRRAAWRTDLLFLDFSRPLLALEGEDGGRFVAALGRTVGELGTFSAAVLTALSQVVTNLAGAPQGRLQAVKPETVYYQAVAARDRWYVAPVPTTPAGPGELVARALTGSGLSSLWRGRPPQAEVTVAGATATVRLPANAFRSLRGGDGAKAMAVDAIGLSALAAPGIDRVNLLLGENVLSWAPGQAGEAWVNPEPTALQVTVEDFTLTAVGDILTARKIGRHLQEAGMDYALDGTRAALHRADIAFCNLENPLTTRGTPIPNKQIWFRGDPTTVQVLQDGRFDVVSLSNNHILDYDSPGLLETFAVLDAAGVPSVGAGRNRDEAELPTFVEVKGRRLAFLAYNQFAEIFWSWTYRRTFAATDALPGNVPMLRERILPAVASARGQADLVVVYLHWGEEDQPHPLPEQRVLARAIVDAGADLLITSHVHVLQGIEAYRGKPILYSLGNFVFDQRRPRNVESMLAECLYAADGSVRLSIIPALIVEGQPRVATGQEAVRLLQYLASLSRPLGTELTLAGERAELRLAR